MLDRFGKLIMRAFTNKMFHIADRYTDDDGSAIYINDAEGNVRYKLLSSESRSSLFAEDGSRLISWDIAADPQRVYLWDGFKYTNDFDALVGFLKLCGWTFDSDGIADSADGDTYTVAYAKAPTGALCMVQHQNCDGSDKGCQQTRIIYKDRCIFKLTTKCPEADDTDDDLICLLNTAGRNQDVNISVFRLAK